MERPVEKTMLPNPGLHVAVVPSPPWTSESFYYPVDRESAAALLGSLPRPDLKEVQVPAGHFYGFI